MHGCAGLLPCIWRALRTIVKPSSKQGSRVPTFPHQLSMLPHMPIHTGERDVTVGTVLDQGMIDSLCERMKALGWDGVDEASGIWHSDLKRRKIISEFMKDPQLGLKRLVPTLTL